MMQTTTCHQRSSESLHLLWIAIHAQATAENVTQSHLTQLIPSSFLFLSLQPTVIQQVMGMAESLLHFISLFGTMMKENRGCYFIIPEHFIILHNAPEMDLISVRKRKSFQFLCPLPSFI